MNRDASSAVLNLLPLGIPTLIISDDPQLIAAARAAYAYWLAEAPLAEPRIELRLETGNPSRSADVCSGIFVEGSRLSLRRDGAEGTADAAALNACVTVSPQVAQDAAALTDIIDTLLLFMLARDGRTPVHASAFMVDELAVVLAGSSGSGKSTLALAAAERGLALLSDDMVFVQQEPVFTLWGIPRPIHVFPADAPAAALPTRYRNDKLKIAVPVARPALKADQAALVVLDRGSEMAIHRLDANEAVASLMQLDAGFDLLVQESAAALRLLASRGAWRLTLADHPSAAVDLLARHFGAEAGIIRGEAVYLGQRLSDVGKLD